LNWLKGIQLLCVLFCFSSCSSTSQKDESVLASQDSVAIERNADSAFHSIKQSQNHVHSGDLILRTGKDFTSDVVRKMSKKDPTYSHCGIANWENDTLFVYHSLGGQWNPDQTIRRDPYIFFCNPYENKGFGVFRYKINPTQMEHLIQTTRAFYHQKITFDMQFDLATNDKMYCTEFIYKILLKALPNEYFIQLSEINHIPYVAVDNLFLNPHCREIKRVVFSQP
jgi:hypothetical protein